MHSKLSPTNAVPEAHPRFPVLMSYAVMSDKAYDHLYGFKELIADPHIEMLLDSGAFTALNAGHEIKLSDYLKFLETWHDKLFGYMALDVLGDPIATDKNLQIMLKEGFKPIPVHVRGDTAARMDQLFEWSDWVALGGLRRPHAGWAKPSYVRQKMLWAKGRNVHWLGYTREGMVRAFRPYSCDSSNWATGGRWGTTNVYLGGGRWVSGHISQYVPAVFTPELVKVLAEIGYTPEKIMDKSLWRTEGDGEFRNHTPFMVTAHSAVRHSYDIRRTVGTREFLAITPIGNHGQILHEIIHQHK